MIERVPLFVEGRGSAGGLGWISEVFCDYNTTIALVCTWAIVWNDHSPLSERLLSFQVGETWLHFWATNLGVSRQGHIF